MKKKDEYKFIDGRRSWKRFEDFVKHFDDDHVVERVVPEPQIDYFVVRRSKKESH